MNSKLIKILFIITVICIVIITIFILSSNRWKINYLREIYPLITDPTEEQYDNLEFFITSLLPEQIVKKYSNNVYTALFPGPSCSQLPCNCDDNKIPNVSFSPNPMLKNKWPHCNIEEEHAELCCSSSEAYKKCLESGIVKWKGNDTWTGNFASTKQKPPQMNQLWKPSLWPKYTLAVNKFPPNDWNSFYNAKGDPDNYWIEVIHSTFSIDTITYGVWFYKTIGSGMFINLGKTIAGLNKLDVIFKLGFSPKDLSEFILRDFNGSVLDTDDPNVTGLGGLKKLEYWLAGQYLTNLEEYFTHNNLWSSYSYDNEFDMWWNDMTNKLVEVLNEATYGKNYDINRIVNTGMLDYLITWLVRKNKYNSAQFTCQSNLYNGFTTEIIILGFEKEPYTDIRQIPKSQFRVMDPNNLPTDSNETTTVGKACTFDFPFSCVYCKESPVTMNDKMGCTYDISKYNCNSKNKTY